MLLLNKLPIEIIRKILIYTGGYCRLQGSVFNELKTIFFEIENELSHIFIKDLENWNNNLLVNSCKGYYCRNNKYNYTVRWHSTYSTIDFIKWFSNKDLVIYKLIKKKFISQFTNHNIVCTAINVKKSSLGNGGYISIVIYR